MRVAAEGKGTHRAVRRALASAIAIAPVLAACVHVDDVQGPHGEPSHRIRCSESADCFHEASKTCPDGYRIRTGKSHGTELVVTCAKDVPANEDDPIPTVAADPTQKAPREDSHSWDHAPVCEAAYKDVEGLAGYWADSSPGWKRLDALPAQADFVRTCDAMPEEVQRCLHDKYRVAHDASCAKTFTTMPTRLRDRIDKLFLDPVKSRQPRLPRAPGDAT